MQLIRFATPGGNDSCWGVATNDGIYDCGRWPAAGGIGILHVIADWQAWRVKLNSWIAQATPLESPVKLLSPTPDGGKLLCIGLNYRDHAIESGMPIPSEPVVFNKLAGCLCGHESVVPLPTCSQQVDYEAELVVVIGSRAWQVSEEAAQQHIFGYTCGHDVSARDWQLGRPGGQWLLGKSFPCFAPIGPAIVPQEEVVDAGNLKITMRINGQTMQDSNTSQLIFAPAQLVSFLSQVCVLEPGDIIFTGTPPGVGMARNPPRFLRSGDECEVEIESIGKLRNRFESL